MERRWMVEMTVEDMRLALKKTKTVLVPLGVTEQHGYHLPLSTDVYNAYEVAKRASLKTGAVVAPPLYYSYSGGSLPGTINVSPQVMSLLVGDICLSLAQQGFRNILLMLGHGGTENMNALKDSTRLFLGQHPELKIVLALVGAWEFSKTWMDAFADHDFHAGYIETSVMMYLAPKLVRKKIVLDKKKIADMMCVHQDNYQLVEKAVDAEQVVPRITQKPEIKVGVMGYPLKANRKVGERVVRECVEGTVRLIQTIEKKGGSNAGRKKG